MVWKNSLFFLVLIGSVFADDIFLPRDDPPADKKCTVPGRMCSSCTSVSYCIQFPDGSLVKEELYTCPSGQSCMDSLNDCTNQTNPKCDSNVVDYKFKCHQIGVFPDPFDCTKYHMCVQDTGAPSKAMTVKAEPNSYKCSGDGYSYDPLSTQCRNKLINGTCKNVAPPCTTPGQTGIIAANPNMYYICLKGATSGVSFPNIFNCQNGQIFNGVACQDQYSPPSVGADGKCLAKGYFDDPINCKGYWECLDKNLYPNKKLCPIGYKWSYLKQTCIAFECP